MVVSMAKPSEAAPDMAEGMNPLSFTDELLARQPTSGIDVVTTLSHFAIVTYRVAPDALRPVTFTPALRRT